MQTFHSPAIEDRVWIGELARKSGRMGCENTFGYLSMWQDPWRIQVAKHGEFFFSRLYYDGRQHYSFPVGSGDPQGALDWLLAETREEESLLLYGITPDELALLEKAYPNRLTAVPARNTFDYLYDLSDLATLPGKKYHGKRNHISWFEKNLSWSFEELTPDKLSVCRELLTTWEGENREKDPDAIDREHTAINRLFAGYEAMGLLGGLLYADGRPVAFCLGEGLNDRIFCTHTEKADGALRGAYPMINREFSRLLLEKGYTLVNREEDDGVEGLRKAKLSYYPAILLEKYRVEISR